MKKLMLTLVSLALIFSFAGCKKNDTEVKRITKIGDMKIDDITYDFYYNAYFGQTNDKKKATELANKDIESVYIATQIGKKMNLEPQNKDLIYSQIRGSANDEQFKEFLEQRNITEEFMDTYVEAMAYSDALRAYATAEGVKNADLDQFFKDNFLRAKHVLVITQDVGEAEKPEKKKLAEDILKRAESGEDFDKLVAEYSEDPGSTSQPDGYVFDEGDMVDEFYQGTKNTKIGEYTLVESDYGYHVIKRLALDETPELYEKFKSQANLEEALSQKVTNDFVKQKKEELGIKIEY